MITGPECSYFQLRRSATSKRHNGQTNAPSPSRWARGFMIIDGDPSAVPSRALLALNRRMYFDEKADCVRRTIVCESKCRKKLHTRSETTLEETRRCSTETYIMHTRCPVRHTRACTVLPYARRVMLSDHPDRSGYLMRRLRHAVSRPCDAICAVLGPSAVLSVVR